jgi:hypothetical protein
MGYRIEEDFSYVQETLATMALAVGMDIENIDSVTLNELMEACSNTYGNVENISDSPSMAEQYAELRRHQLSFRRFWYMYHLLKERINNG